MGTIWNEFLYRPLFNLLIWIYNNWTDGNFGWAVIYLTIILRTGLLPLSLVNEYNKLKNEALYKEIKESMSSDATETVSGQRPRTMLCGA